jgi:hypothetical protein
MNDEALWKRRFLQLTLVRLAGLTIFLFGVAVVFTDLLRPGGWPRFGALLIVAGGLDSVLAPRIMKRLWKHP